jgi:hypothetical protein
MRVRGISVTTQCRAVTARTSAYQSDHHRSERSLGSSCRCRPRPARPPVRHAATAIWTSCPVTLTCPASSRATAMTAWLGPIHAGVWRAQGCSHVGGDSACRGRQNPVRSTRQMRRLHVLVDADGIAVVGGVRWTMRASGLSTVITSAQLPLWQRRRPSPRPRRSRRLRSTRHSQRSRGHHPR